MTLLAYETEFWLKLDAIAEFNRELEALADRYSGSALRWFQTGRAMPEKEEAQWKRKRDELILKYEQPDRNSVDTGAWIDGEVLHSPDGVYPQQPKRHAQGAR